jgi:prepilin-type N-terminal cleavage/methylation domain-containing protein
MNIRRFSSSQGFTLIEVLVAIAVIGIFAAIAAPSFTAWLNNKKVDDVAAQLEGAIREAQAEAIKRSQACTLEIGTQVTSTPANCLPSGPRDLTKLGLSVLSSNDSGVSIGADNLPGPPPSIPFTFKGTISIAGSGTGLITIYQGTGSSNGKMRCIAIASGIGIIRTGRYLGSSPEAPTDTNNCATNMT